VETAAVDFTNRWSPNFASSISTYHRRPLSLRVAKSDARFSASDVVERSFACSLTSRMEVHFFGGQPFANSGMLCSGGESGQLTFFSDVNSHSCASVARSLDA
jgi:hypothetical protein